MNCKAKLSTSTYFSLQWNNLMYEDFLIAYRAEKHPQHHPVFALEKRERVCVAKRRAAGQDDDSPVVGPRCTSEVLGHFCEGVGLPFFHECLSDLHPKPTNQLNLLRNALVRQANSLTPLVWESQQRPRDFCNPLGTIHWMPCTYPIFVQPSIVAQNRTYPGLLLYSNDVSVTDREEIFSDNLGR